MNDKLIQAARCALTELTSLFYEGGLPTSAKQTIIELYDALNEMGEDVNDYQDDYANVVEDVAEE